MLAQPPLPVHLAAQPTKGTAVFNLCLLAEACRRTVAGPPPPASPWQPPRLPRDATETSPTPSHFSLALWTSLPLAPLFPFPRPNGAAATDESHRGYRPPHGSPTPPRAPPVLPRPPRRLTRPDGPRVAAIVIVFKLRPRCPSPSIRPLRRAPELADPPCTSPVSPCSVSP